MTDRLRTARRLSAQDSGLKVVNRARQESTVEATDRPTGGDDERFAHRFSKMSINPPAADSHWGVQRALDETRSASAGLEGGPLEHDLAQAIQSERGNGQPLDPQLRGDAEATTGADLTPVRVHASTNAASLSDQVGARAFTTGRDIFLGDSASPTDREVMFHEITHTLQQGMGDEAPGWIGAADTHDESAAGDFAARSVQRIADDQFDATGGDVSEDQDLPPCDIAFDMPLPEPRDLTVDQIKEYVPDYQPPPQEDVPPTGGSNVAMALRSAVVQRDGPDDDQPHLGVDLGVQYPWSLQTTLVYRDLNLRSFTDGFATLDLLHEPSLTLSQDSTGALNGAQIAVGVLNLHLNLLREETELQLLAQLNAQQGSQPGVSLGPGFQIEQHIWHNISATFSYSGLWTPPAGSQPGHWDSSLAGGAVFHFD